jgi:hypothetical protein
MSMVGIATYFNPAGYRNKLQHLERFSAGVRSQGLNLWLIGLEFSKDLIQSKLRHFDVVIPIVHPEHSVMWQKERLLNQVLSCLPNDVDKVAWLDADIEFTNPDWVEETERKLDDFPVVQCFDVADDGEPSMGFALQTDRTTIHGHPGYAWAARREILDAHGFYDRAIVGGGDLIMAWAMYGHAGLWPGSKRETSYFSPAHLSDIRTWSANFTASVRGRVGCVSGTLKHFSHGHPSRRSYVERTNILVQENFDPAKDIRIANGIWEWASDKPDLHRRVAQYFVDRAEEEAA